MFWDLWKMESGPPAGGHHIDEENDTMEHPHDDYLPLLPKQREVAERLWRQWEEQDRAVMEDDEINRIDTDRMAA